jgi:outer membrane PBP1 activator LpoA protein
MLHRLAKVVLLAVALSGLCPPMHANTTTAAGSAAASFSAGDPIQLAQSDITISPGLVIPPAAEQVAPAQPAEPAVRLALLVPLRSDALGVAADAVRAGFLAAHEREPEGMSVTVVETGDAAQDVLSAYIDAAGQHDIVIGPMTRSSVTAVAQSGDVRKPTIALTHPDLAAADLKLPQQLLVIGLSIEDEARQVAKWAGANKNAGKAVIISSNIVWQRRAANAFAEQWQKQGKELESIELPAFSGYLAARDLAQLKTQFEFDKPGLIFAALDERQARQLRASIGNEIPLYGTSQLNPVALADWGTSQRATDMNGIRLLDIPWQLQSDHPAVMVYPRLVVSADQRRSADIERLYALGIDAYRVAREIALKRTSFELDGVTGKLRVRFDSSTPSFERTEQQAVYRDGSVMAVTDAR